MSFADAWNERWHRPFGELTVNYIGLQSFIRNKKATGRTRDLADIEDLGSEGDLAVIEKLRAASEAYGRSPRPHECRDLRFVTDFPNHGEASRKVFNAIVEELGRATREAVVESPYFVIKSGGYAVLEDLHRRGVHVRVLTNSLASTDASYAVAALYPWLGSLAGTGLTLSAYSGKPVPEQSTDVGGGSGRWGVHSKRGVIDGDTTLLGTYNIDPRSANLNSELMFVCRGQKELAAEVLASIAAREAAAALFARDADREPVRFPAVSDAVRS